MFVLNLSLIYALLGVLGLICLNVILGVAISFKDGTFSLQKLPRFLSTEVLPYGLSLSALAGVAQLNFNYLASNISTIAGDSLTVIAWAAVGAYVLKMLQEIGQKLFTLFGITITETPPAPAKDEIAPAGVTKGDSIFQDEKLMPGGAGKTL